MTFRERWPATPAAPDGVLVWDLTFPPAAVAAVVAICDGYEDMMILRSKKEAGPGQWAAWVVPAFRVEAAELWRALAARFGVTYAGPRPFAPADLAQGMDLRLGER